MNSEPASVPVRLPLRRVLYWSIRRELWENRSLVFGPMIAAAVVLLGFGLGSMQLAAGMRELAMLDSLQQQAWINKPYRMAAIPLIFTTVLIGFFYCLDALYGERRDRSILFWKSMPVSNLITVLSKASIPFVVLPLIGFATVLCTQLIMLLTSTAILLANSLGIASLWTQLALPQMTLTLIYGLFTLALWHAPIYGWLLLVSACVRRSAFLWAVLPPLGLVVLERIAFGSSQVFDLLKDRLVGFYPHAFAVNDVGGQTVIDRLSLLQPLSFLSSPGLWAGLIVAAACLAAAVYLRRYREPI
ncbi:MAG: ABC transporter permease [Gammaproteobacteria bacterium]|nr:ABC transporter permease [Gammaproteobacteria bacterium]